MLDNLKNRNVILASHSPRRRELIKMLDIDFTLAQTIEVDETIPQDMEPESVPEYLAALKADAYKPLMQDNDIYITADTVVIIDDSILGKPVDENDARRMLRSLSGRRHKVVTGVCLTSKRHRSTFSVTSYVDFSPLSDEAIDYYVGHYRPMDKAGAYGIQEWIGAVAISGIEGSFYNVMGLPVQRLYEALRDFR